MDNQQGPTFDNQLIELESIDSTNDYALRQVHGGVSVGGQVYFAHRQWAGKGQRGKTWMSEPGQNISMSLVWNPASLSLENRFLLGAAVALGCLDLVRSQFPRGWTVKWPNDIFQGDRKAGGILIENVIQGKTWRAAIIGVGMNLNQLFFPDELPHAVSLKQITGRDFEPVLLARDLVRCIGDRLVTLQDSPQVILDLFNQNLYKRGEFVILKKGNADLRTRVSSVNAQGELLTADPAGRFVHGEAEWPIG
jgi:BirA family transcriptional regulator, biotin operon repressor / biotin---[acetyl-CoA-carboxylase] ligase